MRWHSFEAPVGRIYAAAADRGLCRLTWHIAGRQAFEDELAGLFPSHEIVRDPGPHLEVEQEVGEYFAGRRRRFEVSLDLSSASDFERKVLAAALRVPYGSTATYSDLARAIRRPRAARGVGNALRRNPIAILVPCHRIVRADGTLGGYAGPRGTPEKRRLLELEAACRED
jgi:methylated-DNA-[protein]-cysteine S-methyltransferase